MTVLDTTPALPAPGSPTDPAGFVDVDVPVLRALRASLADEALRLRRWQRLVQARLDLATDRLSPADELGEHERPPGRGEPTDLVALVRGQVGSATDAVDDLRAVVTTHRALRARSTVLADRLTRVDAALAGRSTAGRCCPRG